MEGRKEAMVAKRAGKDRAFIMDSKNPVSLRPMIKG